jgi:hypothetical protein
MWSLISRGSGQIRRKRRLVSAPFDVSFAAVVQLPPGDAAFRRFQIVLAAIIARNGLVVLLTKEWIFL